MAEVVVPEPDLKLPSVMKEFPAPDFIIKYRGVIDFDGLYKLVCKWLTNRKFQLYETTHKVKPPEIEIVLDGRRKRTAYKRDRVFVHFHMFKNRDVLEDYNGKKIKKIDVRMKITFSCKIETGYPNYFGWNRWQESRFKMVLQNFLNRYILKKEIDLKDADQLYYELYELHGKVKEFLGMESKASAY